MGSAWHVYAHLLKSFSWTKKLRLTLTLTAHPRIHKRPPDPKAHDRPTDPKILGIMGSIWHVYAYLFKSFSWTKKTKTDTNLNCSP